MARQDLHHAFGPLRSVLVATDLSAHARRAVTRAVRLPLADAAEVEILHVLVDPRLAAAARLELAEEGTGAAAVIPPEQAGVHVVTQVTSGKPPDAIVQRAAARAAELVVLGKHGRRVFRDLLFGSTAERVILGSATPVLVVKGRGTRPYRRPLVAVDVPADSCRRALEIALRILDPTAPTIDVVHALDNSAEKLLLRAGYPMVDVHDERAARKSEALASIRGFLASVEVTGRRWRTSVVVGDARRVILEAAARRKSDLIILGTQSRDGLVRVLLGSTAEGVLRGASCDVLIARSPGAEASEEAPPESWSEKRTAA